MSRVAREAADPGDGGLPARALKPEERQAHITELVLGRGSVTAQDLAATFGVSAMTIHRDLDELQRQGVLRKSRGVATAQPSGTFESNAEYRAKTNLDAKRAIGQHACRHVESGMSVLLDDSTTLLQMLPHLAALAPLTVATNYLRGLVELARLPDVRTVALGGQYDVQHDAYIGTACLESVRAMRFDVSFVSTSAVARGFAFHQEDRMVALKQTMIDAADRPHLLVDHTKLGRSALYRLAPLERFEAVIVDSGVPAAALAELRATGATVEVAEPDL